MNLNKMVMNIKKFKLTLKKLQAKGIQLKQKKFRINLYTKTINMSQKKWLKIGNNSVELKIIMSYCYGK